MNTITLCIQKGLPFYQVFEYKEIVEELESAINITNASVNMQFRHTPANPSVLFNAVEGEHIFLSNPTNGEITISIPAEITKSFNFKYAVFDILLDKENYPPIKLIDGQVKVKPLITRN